MRSHHGTPPPTQQKEFAAKDNELTLFANEKSSEIRTLTSRVINLEAALKIRTKENEILTAKARELEEALAERDGTIQTLRSRGGKSEREWEARL